MSEQVHDAARRDRLMRRAIELQDKERSAKARAADEQHFRAAVAEVGVEQRFLDEAERDIAREVAAEEAEAKMRAEKRAAMGRRAAVGMGLLFAASLVSIGIARIAFPPALQPWIEPMDSPTGWSLDVNPGSEVSMDFVPVSGRGSVATLTVERFVADPEGQFRANLDGFSVPSSLRGYETLSVDLSGTLPNARVYLEAGPDERWRSPALSVSEAWSTHDVPIRTFEHQLKQGGRWQTVSQGDVPDGLTQLSVKVGHFMNPIDASGTVSVDAITLK